jgi:ABC-type amino acid transport substrate-binding protein
VEDQLQMVTDGEADLAIAAITINSEREDTLDFSYPYYNSGLQIMTRAGGGQLARGLLSVALSPEALQIVLGFLLIMFIFGNLIWFFERKKNNEEFPQSYFKGVWEGIWWSVVTVTTVGYGDKAPRSFIGRLLGIFTILFGLFLIANFTASITTQLTLEGIQSSINSVDDLPGKRVVTVADSTASQYLTDNYIGHTTTETIEEAVEQLANDQADAIVYDAPILQFLANTGAKGKVQVVGSILQPEYYGVAFPLDSPYRKTVNKALLDAFQNGTIDEIGEKWFGQ